MKKRNETVRPGWPEWCVLALFAALLTLVSVFHEPWFDEAQSWQIAKCASIKEILFVLPHYEGHPPLWHLILMIPAKLGLPYEASLKTIGILFSTAAAALLIFRSPFPRPVKLLLPFSYYLFYQYGVIVRPYCMMMLLFYLLALAFPTRNVKPWRFMLALLFLCLCSAYGIVFAGGICIVWLWDILMEHRAESSLSLKALLRDRRVQALMVLLVAAVLLIAEIMPREDTYAVNLKTENTLPARFLITALALFPEALCTRSNWFSSVDLLANQNIRLIYLIPALLLGALIWFALWLAAPKKQFRYLAIPYLLFAVFSAYVYFYSHHAGLALVYLIFWSWSVFSTGNIGENGEKFLERITVRIPDARKRLFRFRKIAVLLCCLPLLIPVYWTISSSILDIGQNYAPGTEAAQFLLNTGLSRRNVMACWLVEKVEDDSEDIQHKNIDTASVLGATEISAYFDGNIFLNFNNGSESIAYMTHRKLSEAGNREEMEAWSTTIPDVLIGMPELELVYHDSVKSSDFTPVYEIVCGTIWKGDQPRVANYIFVRNDLLEEYGLTEVEIRPYFSLE